MARFVLALGFLFALATPVLAEPPTAERPHEILENRPSGFWTSNRPAVGGAYKYRLLGIGVVLASITGFLTYRLVKNAKGPAEIMEARRRMRFKAIVAEGVLPEHQITSETVISADKPAIVIINSTAPRTKP